MPNNIEGNWISVDEAEDVRGSIRHALTCRDLVSGDRQAWKWAALAIHSAVQGACIGHLTGTAAPLGAVTAKNAAEWIAYFERSRTDHKILAPKTYLMTLPDLLKAIRKPNSAGDGSNEVGIPISDAELQWLKRFHDDIRNQFTHFAPMGWSIEVSGIPDLARLAGRIIENILRAGWAFRHKDENWVSEFRIELDQLKSY